jgi:lysophospholipase L1-like esterase
MIGKFKGTLIISSAAAFMIAVPAVSVAQNFKFDFGNGPVAPGYIGITAQTRFTAATGYGIDSGNVTAVNRSGPDALRQDYLTTTNELFFSVAVAQGNYEVNVILGDAAGTSSTTVKAENRRLLFDRVTTSQGAFISRTIMVRRMETTSIDGSITLSIKDRELGYFTWDKVLTLRFSGKQPAVCGVEITRTDTALTLFLCGNSTVVDQRDAPWSSWGQCIPRFFASGVAIANYAESGLTSGNFLSMKRLSKLLTEVRSGDYVFVEFGHNDQKSAADSAAYAGNLKAFRDQITVKKATPVFVTPTARQNESDPRTSIGGLAQIMRETAQNLGVACIDLNRMVIDLKTALGANAKLLYMYTESDQTHFCEYGGYELARCVLKGLEDKFPSLQSRFTGDYATFDPTRPDPVDILEKDPPVDVWQILNVPGKMPVVHFRIVGDRLQLCSEAVAAPVLSIYNVNGRFVGSERLTGRNAGGFFHSKLLSDLPSGTYLLCLESTATVREEAVFCRYR